MIPASDESGETFEAKEIFCPECNSDYALAWAEEKSRTFVVCDCGDAEPVEEFIGRFRDEKGKTHDDRMYQ